MVLHFSLFYIKFHDSYNFFLFAPKPIMYPRLHKICQRKSHQNPLSRLLLKESRSLPHLSSVPHHKAFASPAQSFQASLLNSLKCPATQLYHTGSTIGTHMVVVGLNSKSAFSFPLHPACSYQVRCCLKWRLAVCSAALTSFASLD